MVTPKARTADSFALVLLDVLAAMKWKQNVLAQKLGVSTKTIGRYVNGQAVPPIGRRIGIVHALSEVDVPLLTRVATSLGVEAQFRGSLPRPVRDLASVKPVLLEKAGSLADDVLDASRPKTTRALILFLKLMVDLELDAKSALGLLETR